MKMTSYEFEVAAKNLVLDYINKHSNPKLSISDISLVWFCKTLENWKAIVIDNLPNNLMYEITYNGQRSEFYFDVYLKTVNEAYPFHYVSKEVK